MYVKSGEFYDQLYHFKNYDAEAGKLIDLFRTYHADGSSLLDVACSTGCHLERLQHNFDVEGLDVDEGLLAVARRRLPKVPLHHADMVDFNLGRSFDIVTCLFASIAYVRTVQNLDRAIASLARHLKPGGLLIVEPWVTPEQYWHHHIVMNVSERPGCKIAWMYVGEEKDRVVTNDIHFIVGTQDGVSHFNEVHRMGLFRHDDYVAAMTAAGIKLLHHDPKGLFGYGLYVARRDEA